MPRRVIKFNLVGAIGVLLLLIIIIVFMVSRVSKSEKKQDENETSVNKQESLLENNSEKDNVEDEEIIYEQNVVINGAKQTISMKKFKS